MDALSNEYSDDTSLLEKMSHQAVQDEHDP